MDICLLVPPFQSGTPVQVTQGQVTLTAGREHAAHSCTGFPFVLRGHPGGTEKYHLRCNRTWISIAQPSCMLASGSGSQTWKWPSFSLPTPERNKPFLHRPRFKDIASHNLSPLITTCLQCHHHLSPYPASSNELPSQICQSCYASSLLSTHFIRHHNPPVNCTLTENKGRGKSQKNNSRPGITGCASFLPQLLPRHLEILPVKEQSLPKARSFLFCL